MGQPMRRKDRGLVPRLLSSVHELHIGKPQPREKMGPALSRGLNPTWGLNGEGEAGQSPQSSCLPIPWAGNLGEEEKSVPNSCQHVAPPQKKKKNISDKAVESRQRDWRRDSLGSANKADGLF